MHVSSCCCAGFLCAPQRSCVVSGVLQTPQTPWSSAASWKLLSSQLLSLLKQRYSRHSRHVPANVSFLPLNPILTLAAISSVLKLCSVQNEWGEQTPFLSSIQCFAVRLKRDDADWRRSGGGPAVGSEGASICKWVCGTVFKNSKCVMENSSNRVRAQMGLVLFTYITTYHVPCEVKPLSTVCSVPSLLQVTANFQTCFKTESTGSKV